MTYDAANSPMDINELVEGTPNDAYEQEPFDPNRTSTMKAYEDEAKHSAIAETGLITAVNLSAEGQENDDAQDADHASGETSTDAETAPDAESQNEKSSRQPTVLIVEDTTELAEVIQATLERMNIRTAHETHGARALQKYSELDPDVVLLDISLPDTTGWKIMDVIKERLEETQGEMPKVIIITAYDDPANRLIGKLQGVHNYLIKPFTSDEIERLVREALGSDVT